MKNVFEETTKETLGKLTQENRLCVWVFIRGCFAERGEKVHVSGKPWAAKTADEIIELFKALHFEDAKKTLDFIDACVKEEQRK
jgi:hypothetical protein